MLNAQLMKKNCAVILSATKHKYHALALALALALK